VSRLSRAWFQASNTGHIVLFDQAFVQAVCSLVLLSGVVDELLISNALDAIPKSDLLIRLDAPTEILKVRLRDRQRLESRFERLLELDSATSLKSLAIVDSLDELLRKGDRQIMNASSLDQHSLDEAVERIEKQITAQFDMEQRGAARQSRAFSDSIRVDRTLKRRTAS
jgi:thymidylate kinase